MDQGEAEEIHSITHIDDDMKAAKEDPMGTNNTANNLTGADDSVIQSSQESDHIPSAQVDITDDMEEDDKVGYKRTQTEMKEIAEGATTQSAPLSTITPHAKRSRAQEGDAERDTKAEAPSTTA